MAPVPELASSAAFGAADVAADSSANQPSPTPPRRRLAAPRRLAAALFGRVADYARRYFQASVLHELKQSQALSATLLEELRATRMHVAHLDATVTALSAAMEGVNQQAQQLGRRVDAVALSTSTTAEGLAEQGAMALANVERLKGLEMIGRSSLSQLETIPALFGPRFDELEIKLRPLIPYDEESVAIRMREGYVLAPRALPTFVTMLANATSKGLEPGTSDVLRRLVRPGMAVADVGANIGLLTLVMASAVGATGKVIAFEPEAVPRENLEKMKYLNGLAWVEVRAQAVGAKAGRLTFHVSDIIGHSSLYALPEAEEARTIEVEVVRLDDVAPAKRLDVVKIDVEGAELDVLAGMKGVIAKSPDLAILAEFGPEHLKRVGQTPAQWFKAFADAGFKPYLIDETTSGCAPTDAKSAAKLVSANIAFVRPGGDAERRLLQR
jgi:FkbM family methyltransferase